MKLTHLRTNHVTEPLGLFMERPVFSWVAEDTQDKRQKKARITLTTAAGEPVYDSGPREDISSLGFEAPRGPPSPDPLPVDGDRLGGRGRLRQCLLLV